MPDWKGSYLAAATGNVETLKQMKDAGTLGIDWDTLMHAAANGHGKAAAALLDYGCKDTAEYNYVRPHPSLPTHTDCVDCMMQGGDTSTPPL